VQGGCELSAAHFAVNTTILHGEQEGGWSAGSQDVLVKRKTSPIPE